jgi:hypothetical protein
VHYDQFVEEWPHGVYEFRGEDALTFESQFEICHTKNNTIGAFEAHPAACPPAAT